MHALRLGIIIAYRARNLALGRVAEGNNYVRRKKGGRRKVGREAETLKIG